MASNPLEMRFDMIRAVDIESFVKWNGQLCARILEVLHLFLLT